MNVLFLCVVLGVVAIAEVSGWACPHGWANGPYGHCYLFSNDKQSWYKASYTCTKLGGQLVAINTRTELNWVKTCAAHLNRGDFWLGGNDIRFERKWVWNPNGGSVNRDCADWDQGQPDDYRGRQDCMLLWASHGYRWDDQSCDNYKYYVCERYMFSERICPCRL